MKTWGARRGLGGLNSPEGVRLTQQPRQAHPEGWHQKG